MPHTPSHRLAAGSSARSRARFAALLSLALALSACSPAAAPVPAAAPTTATGAAPSAPAAAPTRPAATPTPQQVRLSIATGGTGGVYYPLGGGLAKMLSKNVAGVEATAEVTPASVDNMKLIFDKKADIAFTLADTAFDALKGADQFKDTGPVQARTLAVMYSNYMHIVAADGGGINSVADLKGKTVSVGAPGSGAEIKANRILEAFGLDAGKDIKRERLGAAESAGALKDRKLDAFFWDGGLPTAAITDLAATPNIKIKLISHTDAIKKMVDKYGPFYFDIKIPKATYPNVAEDSSVAGAANLLVVNEKMDITLAYNITKAMFEHKEELVAVHKEAEKLTLENAVQGSPLDFHPGAIKYYQEKGVWKR
ncbi:MAG: TAXI family TRAP transporter solute-binding subunit [Chloroflexi bacterium]|nr:TAXI family TRAP transporter solute-binding subunit [Chloroflexota bacterium]